MESHLYRGLSQLSRNTVLAGVFVLAPQAVASFLGFSEMGVFWDWGSLLQGDLERFEAAKAAALERGCSEEDASDAGWKDFRTPSEKAVGKLNNECIKSSGGSQWGRSGEK